LSRYALMFCLLVLVGCYSFRGQVSGNIKSIAIPTFENESTEFGLGETITDVLTRAFERDGLLKVTSESQADAILKGRILHVEDLPYTARADQTVEEYRFSLNCEIQLVDTKTQEPVWTQMYPAWATYPYNGSLDNRNAAIEEAVGKLQQDIVNKIVGNW
jgi:hypothetical protein